MTGGTLNTSDFTNFATLAMNGSNGLVSLTGNFNNSGTVGLSGSGDTLTANGFTNTGNVAVGANETLIATTGYTQSNGSTNVAGQLKTNSFQHNGGITTVGTGGKISASTFNVAGGDVQGTGAITGAVSMSGGRITPGSFTTQTPGTLTINGSFQQSGGIFDELIKSGSNGLLTVNGSVALKGSAMLDLTLLNGFTPTIGQSFDILNYFPGSGLTGTWSNATSSFTMAGFNWGINYGFNGDEVVITAQSPITTTPTPEPSTLVLFGTGLLGLAGYARTRKRFTKRTEAIS